MQLLQRTCYYRIIEYAELERIHLDHLVQQLSLCRTLQISEHVPERIVQMLPKVKQVGAVTTLLGNLLQCPTNLWVKNLFPYVQLKPSTTQLHAISQSPVTGHVSEDFLFPSWGWRRPQRDFPGWAEKVTWATPHTSSPQGPSPYLWPFGHSLTV